MISHAPPLFPEAAENDRRVVSTEGEGVGEDDPGRDGPNPRHDIVEIAFRIAGLTVDRGRNEALRYGQDRNDRLQGPEAPSVWPCIDFVELTGIPRARVPKTSLIARVSIRSLGGVPVPWALM